MIIFISRHVSPLCIPACRSVLMFTLRGTNDVDLCPLFVPQPHQGSAMNANLSHPWRIVFSLWRRCGVQGKQTAAATWQSRSTFACWRRMWRPFSEGAPHKTSACSAVARTILQRNWERKRLLTTCARWVAARGISAPRGTSPQIHPAVRWKEHEAVVTSFILWVSLLQQAQY